MGAAVTTREDATDTLPSQPHKRAPPVGGWIPARGFFALIGYAVFSLVAIAGLLELGAFLVFRLRHGSSSDQVSPIPRSPSFVGVPWAAEFLAEEQARWEEQHGHYVPFRIWGVVPWHSKYINTDETELGTWRRTANAIPSRCEGKRLTEMWMFGGSTVYGTGVPDWATLPSYLSAVLNKGSAECVRVTNLGVEGYVTNQEVMLLIEKLKAGARPAHVIFYDGVNESLVGVVSPGIPTAHASLDAIQAGVENTLRNKLDVVFRSYTVRMARNLLQHSATAPTRAAAQSSLAERADATLANYEANLAIVRLLADAYHFKAHFFWQPSLFYGKKPLAPFESDLIRVRESSSGSGFVNGMAAVCAAADRQAASSGSFAFLGGVFDAVDESIYLDTWMHLSPRGNEIVARAIAAKLELQ